MGIIQDTIKVKEKKDLEPIIINAELTTEKIEEVLTELRKMAVKGPYFDISQKTGVSEADIEAIHGEMNLKLIQ